MNLGHETETIEFKRSTSEMREGMESIAAILNKHEHGELYFGVRADGEVVGQDVSDKTLRDVSQAVGNRIEPRIYPIIERRTDGEGRAYVHVSFEGHEPPYACDGRYRIRSADEDVPMVQEELDRQFAYRRARTTPWDQWESARPVDDVDEDELRAYVERGNECGRISFAYTDAENVLSRLTLIRNGRLTNAAEVLFCPSGTFQLSMGLLADHARTDILDLQHEQGTLFSLVRAAEHYILVNTRRRFVIDDFGPRKEIPELPREAVREVLFNAFCHRDWLSAARVQIDIYHDAVEITNPGWFIEGQSPEEHLESNGGSSLSRNMLIAQALYRSGDIEAYGSGIPRVRDACNEVGVRIEYVRVPIGTKFVFRRNDAFASDSGRNMADTGETMADKWPTNGRQMADKWPTTEVLVLSDSEKAVLSALADYQPRTTKEVAKELDMSDRTARRILSKLTEHGFVVSEGANKNRIYSLAIQDDRHG